MSDTAFGFLFLGIGMVVVLGIVFAITSRVGGASGRATPPRGVHLPAPSYLPVMVSVAGALIGAGLAFRPDDMLANPWIAIPGVILFVVTCVAWVRAANHEWRDTEHGSHGDGGH
jgi:hypothetical protein